MQRVAVARALLGAPALLLADEPTGALDSVTSNDIMQLLKDINRKGVTMIIVTHNDEIAAQTERVIHLKDGLISQ